MHRTIILLLAVALVGSALAASAHSAGDTDAQVQHEGEDHSGDDGQNPLPGFAPVLSLAALVGVALLLRRR